VPYPVPCSFPEARLMMSSAARWPPKGLEAEATLAGCFGERLDAPMVDVGAAVEDHFLDAGLDRALGDQLADGRSSCCVGAGLEPALQVAVDCRGGRERVTL